MKKILVAAALLVFGISNAQVSFKPGFKGGFSSSTVTGYGADYRNNFYLGAYGTLKLGKVYNMQFEMLYLRQGADNLQRSEEHTSELQSRENLVCRLLLEKKNNNI